MTPKNTLRRAQGLALCALLVLVSAGPGATQTLRSQLDRCLTARGLPADAHADLCQAAGRAAAGEHRYAEALAAHQQQVRMDPTNPAAHAGVADALEGLGRLQEALGEFRDAVRLLRELGEAPGLEPHRRRALAFLHVDLGRVLLHLERGEEALRAFREATRINPDDAQVWGFAARAAWRFERFAEAAAAWERALRIDPSYFDDHTVERQLHEIASLTGATVSESTLGERTRRRVGDEAVTPSRPDETLIRFTPGQPIYVTALINGRVPARLVLDTGADSTVISYRTLLAARPRWTGRALRIRGVGGEVEGREAEIDSLQVGHAMVGTMRVIACTAEAIACNFTDAGSDGLLGRDFLDLFEVNIDPAAGQVRLGPPGAADAGATLTRRRTPLGWRVMLPPPEDLSLPLASGRWIPETHSGRVLTFGSEETCERHRAQLAELGARVRELGAAVETAMSPEDRAFFAEGLARSKALNRRATESEARSRCVPVE